LKIGGANKRKTKQANMQQGGSLSYLANENPIVKTFDWRQLVKQNTYVDALPNQVDRYIESAY
jgi:DNA polymerase I-like protein with 3'-5' exonuclease and polymerase domains